MAEAFPQNEEELKQTIASTLDDPFKNARLWDDKERDEYISKSEPSPLWMDEDELEEARKNGNTQLQALQEMVYDQEPDDLAAQFKDQGNSYFKRGKSCYPGAIKAYTEALVQCRKALNVEGLKPEQTAELNSLLASILANRSLVNLKLENFRTVIIDCQESCQLEPTNAKVYYRAAKAAKGLKRYKRGLKILEQGLTCVPGGHASLEKLKRTIQPLLQAQVKAQKLKKAAAAAGKKKSSHVKEGSKETKN